MSEARLERQARQVLARWPVSVRTLRAVAHRENHVYRVDAHDGRTYALRVHRPGLRRVEERESELAWMARLAQAGLRVPTPIASDGGRHIEALNTDSPSASTADLLTWLPGEPMGTAGEPLRLADRIGTFAELGRQMARLHEASDTWQRPSGFIRHRWDRDGLLGEAPVWGRFWEHPDLTEAQRGLMLRVRDAAAAHLERLRPTLDFGLVHADLVRENVLIDQAHVQLIDFDDGGFGFRLFDLATTMLPQSTEPDCARLNAALLEGYRDVRPIDATALPLFMLLRALTYLGWVIPRRHEPGNDARSRRFIDRCVSMALAWLDGDRFPGDAIS